MVVRRGCLDIRRGRVIKDIMLGKAPGAFRGEYYFEGFRVTPGYPLCRVTSADGSSFEVNETGLEYILRGRI